MNRQPLFLVLTLPAALLIAFFCALPSAQPALAGQPGGTMIVTSNLDNNVPDSVLTLREAILIAMGGTGPNGLNRPLTADEYTTAASKCTVDVSYNIIGDCGASYDDVIQFGSNGSHVRLASDLPPINDTGLTSINGQEPTGFATVDGSGAAHGFDLQSDNNVVTRLNLTNMAGYGVHITTSNNLVSGVVITGVTGSGIVINGGGGNRILAVEVGANGSEPCTAPTVSGSGIVLSGTVTGTQITDTLLRCNGEYGILLDGAGTAGNVIGNGPTGGLTGCRVAAPRTGCIEGNRLDGIREQNGAAGNTWSKIPIYDNGGLGISKSDTTRVPAPALTGMTLAPAGYTLRGTAAPGGTVELYQAAPDPSGAGEGRTYLATATADVTGAWSADVGGRSRCFTAFQTAFGSGPLESSEFARNLCLSLYLPLVLK